MRFSLLAALLLTLAPHARAAAAPAAPAAPSGWRAQVLNWREDYRRSLTAPDGWLSVSGLFWLREGRQTFGSGPLNDIVLPKGAAPQRAGVFDFHGGTTTVRLDPGVSASLGGKRVTSAVLEPDAPPAGRLRLGRLTLYVHQSGPRYAVRLKDPQSPLRRSFHGLRWFPLDPRWRVEARFTPYPKPETVEVQNVMGDVGPSVVPGYAEFSIAGKSYRLEPELEDDGTFEFVFRDLTSGRETYPAARFLDTPAPKDGRLVLDFNEAYNPPCAYNRFTTCPLPRPGNRLPLRVTAGEKNYHRP